MGVSEMMPGTDTVSMMRIFDFTKMTSERQNISVEEGAIPLGPPRQLSS